MRRMFAALRTLLVLGRVSNLPTVWSNLLAGWVLVEQINSHGLQLVLVGGSCLYVGGMFLNDYCDAAFDAQYGPQRPIPAGRIPRRTVGSIAMIWFAAGTLCFVPFGWITRGLAVLLLAAIVLYSFHHKGVAWAPLLMGFCRFLLYPLAATAAAPFYFPAYVLWSGAALALYVIGITYLARGESRPGHTARWAVLLLLAPIALSIWVAFSYGYTLLQPLSMCGLLLLWIAYLVTPLWWKADPSVSRIVGGLLAGIVLVDMVAIAPALAFPTPALGLLFLLALLLQRSIPAT